MRGSIIFNDKVVMIILMVSISVQSTAQNVFLVKQGIPCLPVYSEAPSKAFKGAIYINKSSNKLCWYTGENWLVLGTDEVLAGNISISDNDTLNTGDVLTATYSLSYYGNITEDDCAESGTTFQWYRAGDSSGTNKDSISGATGSSYTVSRSDMGKYLAVGITPGIECSAETSESFSAWKPVDAGSVVATDVSFTTGTECYTDIAYTATYSLTYSDSLSAADCAESGTTFQWYRASDSAGTNKTAIIGATDAAYTVVVTDTSYYLAVGVIPGVVCSAETSESLSGWIPVSAVVLLPPMCRLPPEPNVTPIPNILPSTALRIPITLVPVPAPSRAPAFSGIVPTTVKAPIKRP